MLEQLDGREDLAARLDLVHALAKLLGHVVAARVAWEAVAPERRALRALGDLEDLAQPPAAPLGIDGARVHIAPGKRRTSGFLGVLGRAVVAVVLVVAITRL